MSKIKKALIIGINGQDGAFLAKYLLGLGYKVYGTSRDSELSTFSLLKILEVYESVILYSMSLIDFRSVMQVILEIQPDEIYNLAGQTSVGLSFKQPVETLESISIGTLNILEVIRFHKLSVKFYNASSSECFGNTMGIPANENTPFRPRSPYAVAKAAAFWQVANYREAYNLYACSGILFNHESYLRPLRFVTQKIISTVCDIANKRADKLILGNLDIERDWGWAPEYVEAMHAILQQEIAEDFVIATGKSITLQKFVEETFNYFGLSYKDYIVIDKNIFRPADIIISRGNAANAKSKLNWSANTNVFGVIKNMIEYKLHN